MNNIDKAWEEWSWENRSWVLYGFKSVKSDVIRNFIYHHIDKFKELGLEETVQDLNKLALYLSGLYSGQPKVTYRTIKSGFGYGFPKKEDERLRFPVEDSDMYIECLESYYYTCLETRAEKGLYVKEAANLNKIKEENAEQTKNAYSYDLVSIFCHCEYCNSVIKTNDYMYVLYDVKPRKKEICKTCTDKKESLKKLTVQKNELRRLTSKLTNKLKERIKNENE